MNKELVLEEKPQRKALHLGRGIQDP